MKKMKKTDKKLIEFYVSFSNSRSVYFLQFSFGIWFALKDIEPTRLNSKGKKTCEIRIVPMQTQTKKANNTHRNVQKQ